MIEALSQLSDTNVNPAHLSYVAKMSLIYSAASVIEAGMRTKHSKIAGSERRPMTPADTLRLSRAALLDWDGCVVSGGELDIEATRFIAEFKGPIAIVSNNSTCLPADFVELLRPAGLSLEVGAIVLAGVEAVRRALEKNARRVMMIGTQKMEAFARSLGLEVAQREVDTVLLLRDPGFSYDRLERAANALRQGARLIVANPDLTHPGKRGWVVPETGALLAALTACVDRSALDLEIIGKPAARLFERACAALDVDANDAVMIGDNPDTDIVGAEAYGIRSILIGPRSGLSFKDLRSV